MLEDLVVWPKGHIVSYETYYKFLVNTNVTVEPSYAVPSNYYFCIKELCGSCEDHTVIDSIRFPDRHKAQEALNIAKGLWPTDCLFAGPFADKEFLGFEVKEDVTEQDILHGIRSYAPEFQVHYLQEFGLQSIADRYFTEVSKTTTVVTWERKK